MENTLLNRLETTEPPPLSLRPRQAAKALGISPRKLWSITSPRGPIRAVKVGAAVVYPLENLREFLANGGAA